MLLPESCQVPSPTPATRDPASPRAPQQVLQESFALPCEGRSPGLASLAQGLARGGGERVARIAGDAREQRPRAGVANHSKWRNRIGAITRGEALHLVVHERGPRLAGKPRKVRARDAGHLELLQRK